MGKIGRNDPCPCGSGKKYKKCCIDKNINFINNSKGKIVSASSDFDYIIPIAKKLNTIISKYKFEDLVVSAYCLNIWRKNRSSLAQILTLNMAICECKKDGKKSINTFSDFKEFYKEISNILSSDFSDYIIDDYGEVFINLNSHSYPVITGTGHQQVYSVLRFLVDLACTQQKEKELEALLAYSELIIKNTRTTNLPNIEEKRIFELPSEEHWETIVSLLKNEQFRNQVRVVSSILDFQDPPIEKRHFVCFNNTYYPLYNSSFLVDYYSFLLQKTPYKKRVAHIEHTLLSLVNKSYNFSNNNIKNQYLIKPMVYYENTKKAEKINGILFAGKIDKDVIIVINKDVIDTDEKMRQIKGNIKKAQLTNCASIIEPFKREGLNGNIAFPLNTDCNVIYLIVEMFTDITSQYFSLGSNSEDFSCSALDLFYIIGFSENNKEVVEFINFYKSKDFRFLTFGGISNFYFLWRSQNKQISRGAIEFSQILIDYNETDYNVYTFFCDEAAQFPRNNRLFSDPLNWNFFNDEFGYKLIKHKGDIGFGGFIKRISENCFLFLAHNSDFLLEIGYKRELDITLSIVDELNQKLFNSYSSYIKEFKILENKTLELLFMPWDYAIKNLKKDFFDNQKNDLVFCDEYIEKDMITIRFTVNTSNLIESIKNAENRKIENTYFIELLEPLCKYSNSTYQKIKEILIKDFNLKKTVGIFRIEQEYYLSDLSDETKITAVSFSKVKKEIAKICQSVGVVPKLYKGKEATKTIRQMQETAVSVFEAELSKYDVFDIHKKILSYYSYEQHGVIVNLKRYTAFDNLDEKVQQDFEEKTREIREECRRNVRTAEYLLESNLAIDHIQDAAVCDRDSFNYLLAFSDWLVILQEKADVCYYTDYDIEISINDEYILDVIVNEDTDKIYQSLLERKYNVEDYLISDRENDLKYINKFIDAFKTDIGIDFRLLMDLLTFMELSITEENFADEIYPNVFAIEKQRLNELFIGAFPDKKPNEEDVNNTIRFLLLNTQELKTIENENYPILPIWQREKRDNRFNTKPIVEFNDKYVFSPVSINTLLSSWANGVFNWFLPYEINLPTAVSVLKEWKNFYENKMVQDIANIFQNNGFSIVEKEVDLYRRFPNNGYPDNLGDYDVFAINEGEKEIWIIESKVLQKVGSIFEDQMQQKSFFIQHKDDEKFQRRIDYLKQNKSKVLESFGYSDMEYNIVNYMVTNKLFASRYKKIKFPIITFSELKNILVKE